MAHDLLSIAVPPAIPALLALFYAPWLRGIQRLWKKSLGP